MDSYENQIHQKMREIFNIDPQPEQSFEDILLDRASCLLPYVTQKTKNKIDPRKRVKIDLIKTPVINGFIGTPDRWNTFHIGVSRGMLNFVYKIVKLFLSRMALRDDERVLEESQISNEEMLIAAEKLMQGFWENELWKIPSFKLTRLNKSQIELASHLLHYAECFVLAHEFGHAVIEICPEEAKRELYIASGATINRSRSLLDSLAISEKDKTLALEKWPKELAADLIGLELCLEQRDDPVGRSVIRASVELVFVAMSMLEKYREFITRQNYWAAVYQDEKDIGKMDHPPTEWRWEFIHAYVDPLSPMGDVGGLGMSFKQFSDYLLDHLG
jgi:hypothetical protein